MTRKITVIALILILCAAMGASAFEQKSKTFPWMASYNGNGQLNLYASIGYLGWFNISAGPEIIIANFDLAGIPLEFGVMARANIGLGLGDVVWGVAGMASLHWGVDFGAPWKFDWYIAAGLGFGTTWTLFNGFGVGLAFASFDGFVWQFSDKIGLLLDYGYIGYASSWGIGIKLAL